MFVGSMLSISIYVSLLALSGNASRNGAFASSNQPESSLEETSVKALLQGPYRWNNGLFGGDVRLHEGWDGIPSTESVDSEMVVSFDNDLEGKKPQSSLETVDGDHWLTMSRTRVCKRKRFGHLSPPRSSFRSCEKVLRAP